MKKFLKYVGIILVAIVVLLFVSLWYVRFNPLARDSNYSTYEHAYLKLSMLLPKDCSTKSVDAGFVCKSSDYQFGPGLQKGYLVSLQAKYVSPNLKEESAWRTDTELILDCKQLSCSRLKVDNYPAEQISVPMNSASSSYYIVTTLLLKDGIQYGLTAEALTKSDAEQITFEVLKQFAFSK